MENMQVSIIISLKNTCNSLNTSEISSSKEHLQSRSSSSLRVSDWRICRQALLSAPPICSLLQLLTRPCSKQDFKFVATIGLPDTCLMDYSLNLENLVSKLSLEIRISISMTSFMWCPWSVSQGVLETVSGSSLPSSIFSETHALIAWNLPSGKYLYY